MAELGRRTFLTLIGVSGAVGTLCSRTIATTVTKIPASSTGVPPLTDGEFRLVAAMAEGIVPATDTAGAIGAGVPEFFRTIFNDWLLKDEQLAFRAALADYDKEANERFGKSFAECEADQQFALLKAWDAKAMSPSVSPPHAFAQFKRLTLHGYYTSQVGMEQELGLQMGAGLDHPNGPAMDVGGFLT